MSTAPSILNKEETDLEQSLREIDELKELRKIHAKERTARQGAVDFQQQLSPQIYNDYQQESVAHNSSLQQTYDVLLSTIRDYATPFIFKEAILAEPRLSEILKPSLRVIESIKQSQQVLVDFHQNVCSELSAFQQRLEENEEELEIEYQTECVKFEKESREIGQAWATLFHSQDVEALKLGSKQKAATQNLGIIEARQIVIKETKKQLITANQNSNDHAARNRSRLQLTQLAGGMILVVGLLTTLSILVFPLSASLLLTIGCAVSGAGLLLLSISSIMRGISTSRLRKENAELSHNLNRLAEEYKNNEAALPGLRKTASQCQIECHRIQEEVKTEKERIINDTAKSVAATKFTFFEGRSKRWRESWLSMIANASTLKERMMRDELTLRTRVSEQERELGGIQLR